MRISSDATVVELEEYLAQPAPVTIGGIEMLPAAVPLQRQGLWTSSNSGAVMSLIIPDEAAQNMDPYLDVYVANYAGDKRAAEKAISAYSQNFEDFKTTSGITVRTATKLLINVDMNATTTSMIFVGIYLGLVFLIAGAAVLALQQLSEAADNKKRYDLLRKLGTEQKMISKSIFTQVGLYFFIPLALAVAHSVVWVWVMNQGVLAIGYTDVIGSAVFAALFIVMVYGGYFLATYFGCKNIINTKSGRT